MNAQETTSSEWWRIVLPSVREEGMNEWLNSVQIECKRFNLPENEKSLQLKWFVTAPDRSANGYSPEEEGNTHNWIIIWRSSPQRIIGSRQHFEFLAESVALQHFFEVCFAKRRSSYVVSYWTEEEVVSLVDTIELKTLNSIRKLVKCHWRYLQFVVLVDSLFSPITRLHCLRGVLDWVVWWQLDFRWNLHPTGDDQLMGFACLALPPH